MNQLDKYGYVIIFKIYTDGDFGWDNPAKLVFCETLEDVAIALYEQLGNIVKTFRTSRDYIWEIRDEFKEFHKEVGKANFYPYIGFSWDRSWGNQHACISVEQSSGSFKQEEYGFCMNIPDLFSY